MTQKSFLSPTFMGSHWERLQILHITGKWFPPRLQSSRIISSALALNSSKSGKMPIQWVEDLAIQQPHIEYLLYKELWKKNKKVSAFQELTRTKMTDIYKTNYKMRNKRATGVQRRSNYFRLVRIKKAFTRHQFAILNLFSFFLSRDRITCFVLAMERVCVPDNILAITDQYTKINPAPNCAYTRTD